MLFTYKGAILHYSACSSKENVYFRLIILFQFTLILLILVKNFSYQNEYINYLENNVLVYKHFDHMLS